MNSKNIEKYLAKIMQRIADNPNSALEIVELFGDKYTHHAAGIILHFKEGHSFAIRITDLKTGV